MWDPALSTGLSEQLGEIPLLRLRREQAAEALGNKDTEFPEGYFPQAVSGAGLSVAIVTAASDAEAWEASTIVSFAEIGAGNVGPQERQVFEELYGSQLHTEQSDGALRHMVLRTQGVYIRIPDGIKFSEPIRLFWKASGEWAGTHVVLSLGKGAQATVVEELQGKPKQWSHVCEATIEEAAVARIGHLEQAGATSGLWIRQYGSVHAGGQLQWLNASIGGQAVEHALQSTLAGADSTSDVQWMAYGRGSENVRLTARNVFDAPRGGGKITMRAVAEESAHIRCNGMIAITLQGGGTDTYLTQEVLMLDPTAKVDAIPGLEIKTNDVKASHSATVMRVTDEDIFYFAARGIPERPARQMFTEGFLGDLAVKIGDTRFTGSIAEAIAAKYMASGGKKAKKSRKK